MAGAGAFIDEAEDSGKAVLVVVDRAKTDALRGHVGDRDGVHYVDVVTVGANPARLLSVWRDFVDEFAGEGAPDAPVVWGIGEPVWPGRTRAELDECRLHEALVNVAFSDGPAWNLLCPYDAAHLDPSALRIAIDHHPVVSASAGVPAPRAGHGQLGPEEAWALFAQPLSPPPPDDLEVFDFERTSLVGLRHHVRAEATRLGLGSERADDFTLAVDEVATNSVLHGGGHGTLRLWIDGRTLVCEVRDAGRLPHPLVGRRRPDPTQEGGRGLWMANQLCDLVQVRNPPSGAVARLHIRVP